MDNHRHVCSRCRSAGAAPADTPPTTRSWIASRLRRVRSGLRHLLQGTIQTTDVCAICGQPEFVLVRTRGGRKVAKPKIPILPGLVRKLSTD